MYAYLYLRSFAIERVTIYVGLKATDQITVSVVRVRQSLGVIASPAAAVNCAEFADSLFAYANAHKISQEKG